MVFSDPPNDADILSFLTEAGLENAKPTTSRLMVYANITHDAFLAFLAR